MLSENEKKTYYALVRWTEGDENGTYTVGVNTKLIKEFSIDNFLNEKIDSEKELAVKWRETKKKPLGGWNCFMATIVYISSKYNKFKRKYVVVNVSCAPGQPDSII